MRHLTRTLLEEHPDLENNALLVDIANNKIRSIFYEVRASLLLGSVVFVSGAGIYIRNHFDTMGRTLLKLTILSLTTFFLFYSFRKAKPFTKEQQSTISLIHDASVFLAALLGSICIGYAHFRYDLYPGGYNTATFLVLIFTAILAYRFDHRGVLGLAISAFLTFVGIDFSARNPLEMFWNHRLIPIGIGTSIGFLVLSAVVHQSRLKRHFATSYLYYALILGAGFFISSMERYDNYYQLFNIGLALLGGIAFRAGKYFATSYFRALGILYLYTSMSILLVPILDNGFLISIYFTVSAVAVLFFALKAKVPRDSI